MQHSNVPIEVQIQTVLEMPALDPLAALMLGTGLTLAAITQAYAWHRKVYREVEASQSLVPDFEIDLPPVTPRSQPPVPVVQPTPLPVPAIPQSPVAVQPEPEIFEDDWQQRIDYLRGKLDEDGALPLLKLIGTTPLRVIGQQRSGKSTFVKLILNLYQPQSGTIQLDGVNISQIPASDLRADVGYVQQNPKMFHGTISQNLRLCAPGATDEDIRSVIHALGLYDFIQSLPSGFDTRLNEASQSHLPVGFFQALGLAQAMLRKPQIILLDEPPRASGTELNDVLGRFLESCRGKVTVIMVTSHEQQAELADTVLKLERGVLQPLRKQAMAG